METIKINGVSFEVSRPRKNKLELEKVLRQLDRYAGRTLSQCYDRASSTKVAIYDEWLEWYTSAGEELDYFGVSGYNCMQFSLQALYFDGENKWLLSITACHNKATLIEL